MNSKVDASVAWSAGLGVASYRSQCLVRRIFAIVQAAGRMTAVKCRVEADVDGISYMMSAWPGQGHSVVDVGRKVSWHALESAPINLLMQYMEDDAQKVLDDVHAKLHPKITVELYGANPKCDHEIVYPNGGGIKCKKCGGWFCY